MSSKVDLQHKLREVGYEIGPFASKDTLSNILRLHSLVRRLISPLWIVIVSLLIRL